MPPQSRTRRLSAAEQASMRERDDAELRRRDTQTEAILGQLAQGGSGQPAGGSGSPPSLRDVLFPRSSEASAPTAAQRAAHEARVRETQAGWGPVRRGMAHAADFAGEHVPEFLSGALLGDPTVPATSRANLLGQMLTAGVPFAAGLKGLVSRVARPIRAYHGSPHDFPAEPGAPLGRFRSENIGTGEGAQAYGHGLYFSETPTVAKTYQGKVSAMQGETPTINGRPIDWDNPAENAAFEAWRHDGDRNAAAAFHESTFKQSEVPAILRSGDQLPEVVPPGKMYEVNIHADPDDFLDWDTPLSQQSERVRGAAEPLMAQTRRSFPNIDDPTGEGLSRAYASHRGNQLDVASGAMRDAGIPGIKYLDQGSRAAGEGTRNWVVFDDSLIEVLKVSGVSLPVIEGLRRQAAQNDGAVDITGVL